MEIFSRLQMVRRGLGVVTNSTRYELPSTGGMGILWYTTGGWLMLFVAALFLLYKKIKGKDDGRNEEIH